MLSKAKHHVAVHVTYLHCHRVTQHDYSILQHILQESKGEGKQNDYIACKVRRVRKKEPVALQSMLVLEGLLLPCSTRVISQCGSNKEEWRCQQRPPAGNEEKRNAGYQQ